MRSRTDTGSRAEFAATHATGGPLVTALLFQPVAGRVALASPSSVTPNALTLTSLVLGLAGAGILAVSAGAVGPVGASLVVLLVGYVLDCADGLLARMRGVASKGGAVLDAVVDISVHTAVGVALVYVGALPAPLGALFVLTFNLPTIVTFMARTMQDSTGHRRHMSVSPLAVAGDFPVQITVLLAALCLDDTLFLVAVWGYALLSLALFARLGVRSLTVKS